TGITRDGQSLDQTRNGIARGVVVVPEFPTGSIIPVAIVVGSMGGVIIVLRRLVKIEPGLGLK
ncbi:MAG: hypothetical protein M3263_03600, partial [Thermoproteota archaeon]|nr:hypothetical protein [Thermoproteota archaeon]